MVYRCTVEQQGDVHIVQFPDMPNIMTCGFSQEEALHMAKDALDGVPALDIAKGRDVPQPHFAGGHPVPVANHIAVALQLRALRGSRSQTEIAQRLGLSYQAYQRLENPKRANPTLKTLEKLRAFSAKSLPSP
jgi:antitoxin HicB